MRRLGGGAAVAVLLAGCIPEEGPMMAPGQDCMASDCHSGGEAKSWSVAGTIAGRMGANVVVTDAKGWSFTLRSNKAGNFYTAEGVAFPLQVTVDGTPMGPPVTDGSCNCCHGGGVGAGGPTSTCVHAAGGGGG